LKKSKSSKEVATQFRDALETLPRITNETVTEHREQILSGARKYIYPLQHSKHRVVIVSTSILSAAVVLFFIYCGFALYKFQSYSTFIYDVSRVIPFPIAKAGPDYVAYENYLFELRHYVHYYQSQQKIDFNSDTGKQQLDSFKKQALQDVTNYAYVKQIAAQNHITVSDQDVDNQVTIIKNQNLLGTNEQVFANVLNQYWGWSVDDFKRELKQQLLAQKVAYTLDTATRLRAQSVLNQINQGSDFATLAKEFSDDATTKDNGGQFGFLVSKSNQDLAPQTVNEIFKLAPGQTSGLLDIGSAIEIVKVISVQGNQVQAAHILFNLKDLSTYITPLQTKEPVHYYVKIN
jgi:parvulin-like peptidyl-prolyl isomerase